MVMTNIERMKELVSILQAADRAYYQEDQSPISDQQYDTMSEELQRLEGETGIVLSGSPSIRVGYEVVGSLTKVAHNQPLLSLNKTKDATALREFAGDQACLLAWKLDGLTVVLHYDDGELVHALTRGNGEHGEDITHNARVFRNIPRRISHKEPLWVRGEALISHADFKKLNSRLPSDEQYKNPRNLTSGSIRQLNSQIASERAISFFAFAASGDSLHDSKKERLNHLINMGFDIVPYKMVYTHDIDQALEEFEQALSSFGYATDGLVLTYDSTAYSRSLGQTSKFPHDSLAYKWTDEQAESTLLDVSWNTSRTGLVNPVAIFTPVELEGSTVRQASLHNVSILEGLQLGLGDTIVVQKANMIIPQVVGNLTRSATLELPKKCPVCEHPTELVENNGIKQLFCQNSTCEAQLVRALSHFASRDCANIEGLSEATIEKFVKAGLLTSHADIYTLQSKKDDIVNMEGLGQKSFEKLVSSIESSKNLTMASFINALGIPHVGLSNARLLVEHSGNDFEQIRKASYEELEAIDGYGTAIATAITTYFADDTNNALLDKVLPHLSFAPLRPTDGGGLAGLTFVLTGDTKAFDSRKALKAYIEEQGGKVASGVTPKTNFLVNNNPTSSSSKNKKAHELGVRIITDEELLRLAY